MTQEEFKHLDYVQSAISRMAANQFQIKGWMITVDAAILTFFANSLSRETGGNPYFLLIAVFPTILFWLLDAKFLAQERQLRSLYTDIAQKNDIPPFDMTLSRYREKRHRVVNCMFSFGCQVLYLPVILGFGGAFAILTWL